jgi:hypothetical protein
MSVAIVYEYSLLSIRTWLETNKYKGPRCCPGAVHSIESSYGPQIIYWISETLRENELHIVDGVISTF